MILFGYAIAFGASLHEASRVKTFSMVSFIEAVSNDEAVGKAIAMSKNAYPQADGYSGHWGLSAGVSFSLEYINQKLTGENHDNSGKVS